MRKKKRSIKGFLLVMVIIVVLAGIYVKTLYNAPMYYNQQNIEIKKGDTVTKFFSNVSGVKKIMTKLRLKNHSHEIPTLQEGNYHMEGKYTKQEVLNLIANGPEKEYLHVTVLEGWSRYDIDAMLVDMGLITEGEYIKKTEDGQFISSLQQEFPFLQILPQGKSLEGFLYPDTYFLDKNGDVKEQLIRAQLKNFDKKVWSVYAQEFEIEELQLSPYQILILASVIENEEKKLENKPIIAGIFVNRLEKGMRLDADVTLCYGLAITYNKCRENINKNLNDAGNPYNTRQNPGLMPTPISSPTDITIESLLRYKKTGALYYLHDKSGEIHYAETIEGHNENKSKFL